MMPDHKHKSGAQKRKEKKKQFQKRKEIQKRKEKKKKKTTHNINTFFAKKATSFEQVKVAADFGLQDKASTVAEAPSESKITPHSAELLDLSQPVESEFNGPPGKVSRPDSITTSAHISPAKSAFFLKILAIMPLFHKRCSENFIQTSL